MKRGVGGKKLSGDKLKILSHSNPERDMSKAYSSNLTQWQWELIEAMIPPAKPGGRNREVEVWSVLNAIFYVFTQGCTWRNLPGVFCINPRKGGFWKIRFSITHLKPLPANKRLSQKLHILGHAQNVCFFMYQNAILRSSKES